MVQFNKRKEAALTADTVRAVLDYDPLTGVLTWKRSSLRHDRWNSRNAGKIAGWTTRKGRRHIAIGNVKYVAARVIWLIMTGAWPEHEVDHKDQDSGNDAWENLRHATRNQNASNIGARPCLYGKGITYNRRDGNWRARVRVDGKEVSRYFRTKDLAIAARQRMVRELHGEFARLD
jgi:hypothetical protein